MKDEHRYDESISVIVPTFRRSVALLVALESVAKQLTIEIPLILLVVDNNPDPQEKDLVEGFARNCPYDTQYIHCPEPGVSNARNAGLSHVKSRYIAFLDDDMAASEHWISTSLATAKKFDAGVVFCPALARMPDPEDPRSPYMAPFFSHTIPDLPEGLTERPLGTGGTLVDLSKCHIPEPPFNPDFNETGGEDDRFFAHIRRHGTPMAWSPRAETYEIVPKERATNFYVWERNFAYGQGPCRTQAGRGPRGTLGVLRFMFTGTLQFAVYGPIFLALRAVNHPAYISYMAKTARAMGKIYWPRRFSPRLYAAPKPQKPPANLLPLTKKATPAE